jgi:CubicO group peptidase (beta-lactamase class C family)
MAALIESLIKEPDLKYAVVELRNDTPVFSTNTSIDTIFELGSLSKAFGAYMVSKYVKEGKASWSDPVKKYIPIQSDLTLLEALNHVNDYPEHLLTQLYDMGVDREVIYQRLLSAKPSATKTFRYQNCFYMFLDKMFPNIYADFVTFTTQLQMANTHIAVENTNLSYPPCQLRKTGDFGFAGGVVSTIHDLAIWLRFNMDHNVAIDTGFYHLGWWTGDVNKYSRIHTGGVYGFRSALFIDLHQRIGLGALVNSERSTLPTKLVNNLGRSLGYGENFKCSRVMNSLSPPTNIDLTGTYYNELMGVVTIAKNRITFANGLLGYLEAKEDKYQVEWPEEFSHYYDSDLVTLTSDGFILKPSYDVGGDLVFLRQESQGS